MSVDHDTADERIARLEQLIRDYHATKSRRLLEQAVKLWRRTQAEQALHIQRIREQIH